MNDANDPIDLGSDPLEEFDPFADDADLSEDIETETAAKVPAQQQSKKEAQAPKQTKAKAATGTGSGDSTSSDNPLENAIGEAEARLPTKPVRAFTINHWCLNMRELLRILMIRFKHLMNCA